MLWWPTLAGLTVTAKQLYEYIEIRDNTFKSPNANVWTLAYSIFLALWAVAFLERWKRKRVILNFRWGTANHREDSEERHAFSGEIKEYKDKEGNVLGEGRVFVHKDPCC